MKKVNKSEQGAGNEYLGNKLRQYGFSVKEELYLSGSSYTTPILILFIRISSILFLLMCTYDLLFMPWNNMVGILTHYLPAVLLYIFFELSHLLKYKIAEGRLHFVLTLSFIIALLHYALISPEQVQQVYLFEAVLLTVLYYIVPGKDFSTALSLSLILSLFMISVMLFEPVRFDRRWILNLLFYHLLILGGLMLTYIVQELLGKMVRISSELSSQNSAFQHLKEEFCNTLDGLSLGVILLSKEGRILVYNERFKELSGNENLDSKREVSELRLFQREPEGKYYCSIIERQEALNEELRIEIGSRSLWLSIKGMQIKSRSGAGQYLLLLEEITEQKQNKLARDRLERHLEAVFNSESSIVLYERRGEEWYFTENIGHLTGWSAGELSRDRNFYESLVHAEDKPFIKGKYEKWIANGKEGILNIWYRVNRRDGEMIWLEERASCVTTEDGVEIITGILIDTTELKTTERELRRSEASLNRAQEIAHVGSWLCMMSDESVQVSEELRKILEIEAGSEVNWLDYKTFIHSDDLEELRWKLDEFEKKQKSSLMLEFRVLTARGNEREVRSQIHCYRAGETIQSIEGTVLDITEHKELERQLFQHQKMEAIGTLAGGIAHDFNNILNIIMGYASVIGEQLPNDSDLWHKFDRINAAAQRAKNLVTHILTISRQHESRKKAFMLKELLVEHLELLRAAIPASIAIERDLATESFIYGNADQIEQVVMNLCTNASYAMKEMGGKLWVRLADDGEYVRMEIEDNGDGIPPKVVSKMFDPYFTTKPKGEGTGLGLAIVKGIVEGLEGRIEVESERGEGALFKLWFPKYVPGEEKESEEAEEIEQEAAKLDQVRVMFIDDEEALVELFTYYLESNDMQVTSFGEGKSALEAMESNPRGWDILVSDVSLPGMDGLEILRRVREMNPRLPVILYSGFKKPKFKEKAEALGVNRILVKPVVPGDMLKEIRLLLDKEEN
ncbi:MAG: PAS domain S-box protein [Candidatus Cloacimonetes bacterium]|nr:PAS domain S-box protein [Candidatus Cloacimonadota bacterium]